MRLLISLLNDLILRCQRFPWERTGRRPELTGVIFNLDTGDLCLYPAGMALLEDNMGNALSGSEISEHDSLVIDRVAHVSLLLRR